VLVYEAIVGRRPFNAANISEYADLHCDAPVPPVGEGLPPAFDRFFERALAKRPEQRWRTALELAAALRAEWVAARTSGAGAGDRPVSEVAAPGDDEAAPYLGLAPYAAGDAEQFVGREAEVAAFLERLRTRPCTSWSAHQAPARARSSTPGASPACRRAGARSRCGPVRHRSRRWRSGWRLLASTATISGRC
jgi:serine/threonine-protein kinase